ncbi:MAG: diguanylate cyclase [Planctomycetota bacterium]|nr:diguanylate cyclase [Planctomycetota bacterium]
MPARILYVEGDAEARARVTVSLSRLGYALVCVDDGPAALRAVETDPPDAVLLGLRLVGMEPIEVCSRLKALATAFLPVLYLTTESDVDEKVRVLEAGGDDFCVEPMRVAELDARIRVLLRMREREGRLTSQSNRFRIIAYVDALTEVGNRRAFDRAWTEAWAALAPGRCLALLIIDIDHFRRVNELHGHAGGDGALRAVARTLQTAVRHGDEVFRFGGEEFAVIAINADRAGALAMGERIREAVARSDGPIALTVSVGVAVGDVGLVGGAAALFAAADGALYDAKARGRDRVALADERAGLAGAQ